MCCPLPILLNAESKSEWNKRVTNLMIWWMDEEQNNGPITFMEVRMEINAQLCAFVYIHPKNKCDRRTVLFITICLCWKEIGSDQGIPLLAFACSTSDRCLLSPWDHTHLYTWHGTQGQDEIIGIEDNWYGVVTIPVILSLFAFTRCLVMRKSLASCLHRSGVASVVAPRFTIPYTA